MNTHHTVRSLAMPAGLLLAAGLASVASALFHSEGVRPGGFLEGFLKQVLWAVMGIAAGLALFRISYARIVPWAFPLYIAALAALAGVLFLGSRINGATRWFRLGPLSIQPSEFAKVIVLLALARSLSWPDRIQTWRGFLSAWAIVGIPVALIQLQPDLTTALLLLPSAVAMFWVSGVRWTRWAGFAALVVAGAAFLWWCGAIRDYQKGRLAAFAQKIGWGAESGASRQRSHEREAYQEIQARIAIGSGAVFGKGYLSGTQNQLSVIPMSASDFIFAVIGEEWGFLGSAALLGVYLVLTYRLFEVASATGDPSGRLFAIGFAVHFSSQVIVNIAMATGVFPVVGIPLPLVSAGESSLVATLVGLAIVARIGASDAPAFARE